MALSGFLKVGMQIAAATAKASFFEFDEQAGSLVIKSWLVERLVVRALKKNNIKNIVRVFITSDGINIDHSDIGIICITPRMIVLNNKESILYFDSRLAFDRQKQKLDNALLASTVGVVTGGFLQLMTFGFVGGGLQFQSESEILRAAIEYQNRKQINGLGNNLSFSMPPLATLDPKNIIQDEIEKNGGSITLTLTPKEKSIAMSGAILNKDIFQKYKAGFIANKSYLSTIEQQAE